MSRGGIMKKAFNDIDFKELAKSCKDQNDLANLSKEFMKNMIESMLQAELEDHIETNSNTSKNGSYKKTVRSDAGELELDIPRDRKSDYKPLLIPKGKYTISGIDDKIISMYARGMSLRDIEKKVKEMYDVEMSDSLISRIIDKIIPEIKEWQNRTLEPIYPIVGTAFWNSKSKGTWYSLKFSKEMNKDLWIYNFVEDKFYKYDGK